MAIATGTAIALGVAAGTAVGGVAAAKAQSGAAKHAADIQGRATSDALAYEKERDAKEDALKERSHQEYLAYVADWKARHGQGGGGGGGGALAGGHTIADFDGVRGQDVGAQAAPTLRNLGTTFGADPAAKTDVTDQPTLADLGRWNEWEPYLAQRT